MNLWFCFLLAWEDKRWSRVDPMNKVQLQNRKEKAPKMIKLYRAKKPLSSLIKVCRKCQNITKLVWKFTQISIQIIK